MPALVTHYLCGNKLISLTENDLVKKHISNYRREFNLGTQGPDFLFYYGAFPWTKSSGLPELGHRLHEENTGEFITEALKYGSCLEEEKKGLLAAYLYGYICHYILDCHTHPYIFYKTGFVRKGESYTAKYTCYHRMFETALDVLMLKHELGLKPPDFNASAQIKLPDRSGAVLGEMYSSLLKKVYTEEVSAGLLHNALENMASVSKALRDATGIKKQLLESIEKLMGKPPMFSSMILPLEVADGRDYLNLLHGTWNLPWDSSAKYTESFPEMFSAAAKEAAVLCSSIKSYLFEGAKLEKVMSLIGNRSFSTGLDWKLDTEFVSFQCIYENEKK